MLCTTCYREIPGGSLFCPRCGARQGEGAAAAPSAAPPPVPSIPPVPPPPVPGAAHNPWEEREGRGLIAALGETLQESLFRPAAFFRGTDPGRGAGRALAYGVLVGTVSLVVLMMWERVMNAQISMLFAERLHRFRPALGGWGVRLVVLPIVMSLQVIVAAAIFHLSLKIVGAARAGYGATLKVVAYSCSALAFNVFPVCGSLLGVVWMAVLQVTGFREMHRTSGGRAFFAWALPFLVVSFLLFAALALLAVGVANFWQGLGGRFDV